MIMKQLLALLLILFSVIAIAPNSYSQSNNQTDIPHLVSYQGLLTDGGGKPVSDGVHQLTIHFYADALGESAPVWTDSFSVTTQSGVFSLQLGSQEPLPGPDVMGQPLWVGVEVNGQVLRPLA